MEAGAGSFGGLTDANARFGDGSVTRHRVVCCGMKGVLAYGRGRWVLENEAELAVLEGLGGSSEGVGRLRGIAAALDDGAAGPGDVACLNRSLRSIGEVDPVCWAGVSNDLMAATAVACAHWGHPKAVQWLCWALSGSLAHNLSRAGPPSGWLSWYRKPRHFRHRKRRDMSWANWPSPRFWEYLKSHEDRLVREAAEASDLQTPGSRLKELGRSDLVEVLDLVASHPNTPAKTLMGLASLRSYYKLPFQDRRLLRFRVVQNLSASPQLLGRLFEDFDIDDDIAFTLAYHPNAPRRVLTDLTHSIGYLTSIQVAAHPNTPARALGHHAQNEYWALRKRAAANPRLPVELLEGLTADRRLEVRAAAAANPNLPQEHLRKLADDRSGVVRAAAATNPNLSLEQLRKLATDRQKRVRATTAANPRLPSELMPALANDDNASIRRWAASNEGAAGAVLAQLAEDTCFLVRSIVARNPSAPGEALSRLAGDSDSRIRRLVAEHPLAPSAALERLACDADLWVRQRVASSPAAPMEALARLAADPESVVHGEVAGNPSASAELLARLASNKYPTIRGTVAANPSANEETLASLAGDDYAMVFHPARIALADRQQAENHFG